jgi:hypothetical protein
MMNNKIITMSRLGTLGRWGNSLFQYCFAKAYAERNNCELFIPKDWLGRQIFHIPERTIEEDLGYKLPFSELDNPKGINIDVIGFFQKQEHQIYTREQARQWLKFRKPFIYPKERQFYIAAHLRRGDYLEPFHLAKYAVINERSYIMAAKKNGYNPKDIIWVGEEISKCNLVEDFQRVRNADIIFRSNSTFSYWACQLASHDNVFTPIIEDKTGWCDLEFTKGNLLNSFQSKSL